MQTNNKLIEILQELNLENIYNTILSNNCQSIRQLSKRLDCNPYNLVFELGKLEMLGLIIIKTSSNVLDYKIMYLNEEDSINRFKSKLKNIINLF